MKLGAILSSMLDLKTTSRSGEEIRARYAGYELNGCLIRAIREAEKDSAICAACLGVPCAKSSLPGLRREIRVEGGEVKVVSWLCEYEERARRQRQYERSFELAGIPTLYAGKTFADYAVDADNKSAVRFAEDAVSGGEGLYVYGAPGTGKTMLAAIVAQEYLKRGVSVIFGDVPALLDELKSTMEGGEVRLSELMAALSEVEVLILDDLGTEQATEWAAERLYRVVNARYTSGRRMIVTSNYSPKEVAERLNNPKNGAAGVNGSRIVSRLQAVCKIARIGGADRRLRRRKVNEEEKK